MTFDEAKKKIAKLLRLSTSANQHEAERAASKAAEIMHKYQIEEASLCDAEEEEKGEEAEIFTFEECKGKKREHWQMSIAAGCALICSCKTYWEMGWTGRDGTVIPPKIKIIGRKSDVDSVRYLFEMVSRQVEEAARRSYYQKGVYGVEDKKSWAHAFKLGCATEIRSRLYVEWRERMEEERKKAQGVNGKGSESNALVVLDKRQERVNNIMGSLGLKKSTGPSIKNKRGYKEGVEKGKSVRLGGQARGALGMAKKELNHG